jgi:L-lactate dehydrogenase complex protein LldG
MSAPTASRASILQRIRAATQSVANGPEPRAEAYAALPRGYTRKGQMSAEARVALMIERLREYDAEVVECAPEELPAAITAQIRASGKKIFVAPAETPVAWYVQAAYEIEGFECTMDLWEVGHGLTTREIEQAEGVVTAAFCGVAESGTIVLHHSAAEGRRVLTLLPDWHLCILRASQVVETLPEYFDRCTEPPALVTWISGPSATADIEMTRIRGVHGPRFLHVIVVRDESAQPTLN